VSVIIVVAVCGPLLFSDIMVAMMLLQAVRQSRPLRAVDKYRVRRRHPPPSTIWDGEQTVYCLRATNRLALKQLYSVTKYPSSTAKHDLADKTGLTVTQVHLLYVNVGLNLNHVQRICKHIQPYQVTR